MNANGKNIVSEIPRRGGISLRNLRTFSSLKNPVYRLYYIGISGQWASMNMQQMTNSLLIYRLTDSALLLGVLSLANGLAVLFFSLFGGVIADRMQKKFIVVAGMAGSALVSLGVALALTLGYLSAERSGSWWILMLSAFLQGSVMGAMMPSRQSIIPEIVGEEQLTNAVALNNLGMNTLRFFAPAATGFLIDAFDFKAVYYTMTAMYVMGAAFIAFVPRTSRRTIRHTSALAGMKEGFQYIRREPVILLVLSFTLVGVILSQPYNRLMPIFTEDILKVGEIGLGVLMSISGIGAVVGSLALASLSDKKRGLLLMFSTLLMGAALIGFAFSISWPLSMVLIAFVGLGQSVRMTLGNSLIQSYVAAEYRGRIMSIYLMEQGFTSISIFLAGLLAEAIDVQWAIGSFAMVLVLVSILALVFARAMRKLD